MAYRYAGWACAWQRPSGVMGMAGRIFSDKKRAEQEVMHQQALIDADTEHKYYFQGTRMMLVWVEAHNMTDDTCPTCGPICGLREFGWEGDDE